MSGGVGVVGENVGGEVREGGEDVGMWGKVKV